MPIVRFPRRVTASAIACLVLGSVLTAAPASAAPFEPGPDDSYVALGSSYAAGANLAPADPNDAGGWCGRSLSAYPALVGSDLGVKTQNAACGGAVTANIALTPQVLQNASGTWTAPLQIDAVNADTDLVTITIGGNDVGWVSSLAAEACLGALATNPADPTALVLQQYGFCVKPDYVETAKKLTKVEGSITAAVRAVKAKAPGARIALVDYVTMLPSDLKPCAALPIPRARQVLLQGVATSLSYATRRAAQRTGADFVAASVASRNHDACSADPWVVGYDLSGGQFMHPNAAGHAAVAELVTKTLSR